MVSLHQFWNLPVLEPNLDLPWAESGNFPRETLAMGGIRVWLLGELAHKETSLLVSKTCTC